MPIYITFTSHIEIQRLQWLGKFALSHLNCYRLLHVAIYNGRVLRPRN